MWSPHAYSIAALGDNFPAFNVFVHWGWVTVAVGTITLSFMIQKEEREYIYILSLFCLWCNGRRKRNKLLKRKHNIRYWSIYFTFCKVLLTGRILAIKSEKWWTRKQTKKAADSCEIKSSCWEIKRLHLPVIDRNMLGTFVSNQPVTWDTDMGRVQNLLWAIRIILLLLFRGVCRETKQALKSTWGRLKICLWCLSHCPGGAHGFVNLKQKGLFLTHSEELEMFVGGSSRSLHYTLFFHLSEWGIWFWSSTGVESEGIFFKLMALDGINEE